VLGSEIDTLRTVGGLVMQRPGFIAQKEIT
jgi:hypothetical protein